MGTPVAGIAGFGVSPHRSRPKSGPGLGSARRFLGTESAQRSDARAAQRFTRARPQPVDARDSRQRVFLLPRLGGGGGAEPKTDPLAQSLSALIESAQRNTPIKPMRAIGRRRIINREP